MCEPLRQKKRGDGLDGWFAGNDVRSAVLFYKKYYTDFFKFKEDFPEAVKEIEGIWRNNPNYSFVWWLFEYTFQDVI